MNDDIVSRGRERGVILLKRSYSNILLGHDLD